MNNEKSFFRFLLACAFCVPCLLSTVYVRADDVSSSDVSGSDDSAVSVQPILTLTSTDDGDSGITEGEQAIIDALETNNDNWDLFLDSFDVSYTANSTVTECRWFGLSQYDTDNMTCNYFIHKSDGVFVNQTNRKCFYIPLTSGITYTISYNYNKWYPTFAFAPTLSSAQNGIPLLRTGYGDDSYSNTVRFYTFTYTPSSDGYLVAYQYNPYTEDVSGNGSYSAIFNLSATYPSTYQDSYTLSELGQSLESADTKLSKLETIIQFENTIIGLLLIFNILPNLKKAIHHILLKHKGGLE